MVSCGTFVLTFPFLFVFAPEGVGSSARPPFIFSSLWSLRLPCDVFDIDDVAGRELVEVLDEPGVRQPHRAGVPVVGVARRLASAPIDAEKEDVLRLSC